MLKNAAQLPAIHPSQCSMQPLRPVNKGQELPFAVAGQAPQPTSNRRGRHAKLLSCPIFDVNNHVELRNGLKKPIIAKKQTARSLRAGSSSFATQSRFNPDESQIGLLRERLRLGCRVPL